MTTYLHLRAVPPPALRNSVTWLERLFHDDLRTVCRRTGRHRADVRDGCRPDQEVLYSGALGRPTRTGPRSQVVLGGRPVLHPDPRRQPFLVLTAAQVHQVSDFLETADFGALWGSARHELLPRYGGATAEPEARGAFAAAHRELTAFYARTAGHGEAVVKWLAEQD
ncbi:DUF1877 family protein [Streptomyces sp. IBSBF 3136]|uniref:DUF1877 family protein n=1 Tax=Streptomyces sp. IBSBF 3136 TaxID=2903524 RepID=UPI002FDC5FE5